MAKLPGLVWGESHDQGADKADRRRGARKASAAARRGSAARIQARVTKLAEAGVGEQTIMEIAGQVSRKMLERYRHIRVAAKRKVLNDLAQGRASAAGTARESHDGNMTQAPAATGLGDRANQVFFPQREMK